MQFCNMEKVECAITYRSLLVAIQALHRKHTDVYCEFMDLGYS